MASNNDSISKTLAVVGGLCLVCSILVAGAAVGLRPWQDAAKARDRQANIQIGRASCRERVYVLV